MSNQCLSKLIAKLNLKEHRLTFLKLLKFKGILTKKNFRHKSVLLIQQKPLRTSLQLIRGNILLSKDSKITHLTNHSYLSPVQKLKAPRLKNAKSQSQPKNSNSLFMKTLTVNQQRTTITCYKKLLCSISFRKWQKRINLTILTTINKAITQNSQLISWRKF